MQIRIVNDGKSIEIVAKDGGCQMFYATRDYAQITVPIEDMMEELAKIGIVSPQLGDHTHQAQGLFDLVAPPPVTQHTQSS